MATADRGPSGSAIGRAARGRRSIVVYGWIGLAAQLLFLVGAVSFVIVGSSYQRSAIQASSRVQRLQLANQGMQAAFLGSERSARGYLLSGLDRFLDSYYAERAEFVGKLSTARALAWQDLVPGIDNEGNLALTAFRVTDQALRVPRKDPRSRSLLGLASRWSDRFADANTQVQARLTSVNRTVAGASQRSLGIGLFTTALVLTAGLMIPVVGGGYFVRRTVTPIRNTTATVQRLAAGDHSARAAPAGPAEVYAMASSINILADANDQLRSELQERVRLSTVMRQTAAQAYGHLDVSAVLAETMQGLRENLGCEYADIALVDSAGYAFPADELGELGLRSRVLRHLQTGAIAQLERLYRDRKSLAVQDLRSGTAPELPGALREVLLSSGFTSLLVTPFGIGGEVLGTLVLLRKDPDRPWTQPEVAAVESIASDVARGIANARTYHKEQELVQKLRDVDRAKSDFLAAVTHDLQSPLTSILGYLEVLEDDKEAQLDPAGRRMLGSIEHSATRLQNLVEDLLTMSRIELGTFESKLSTIDLAAVTAEAIEGIQITADQRKLDLRFASPEGGLPVLGDGDQLGRALTNLLTNAVKYTPPGGRVEVSASREDHRAIVAIRDTGIGIPEKDQPMLFTRFFRASNVVNGAAPGTGLGLAIVASIVHNHHGQVALHSRERAGTTVTITLPLAARPPGEQARAGAGPAGRAGAAARNGRGGNGE
jgi:signal transduction histidine kinase/CHASE3 domain sensor protein